MLRTAALSGADPNWPKPGLFCVRCVKMQCAGVVNACVYDATLQSGVLFMLAMDRTPSNSKERCFPNIKISRSMEVNNTELATY